MSAAVHVHEEAQLTLGGQKRDPRLDRVGMKIAYVTDVVEAAIAYDQSVQVSLAHRRLNFWIRFRP